MGIASGGGGAVLRTQGTGTLLQRAALEIRIEVSVSHTDTWKWNVAARRTRRARAGENSRMGDLRAKKVISE